MEKKLIGIPIRKYKDLKTDVIGLYARYLDYFESNNLIVVFLTLNNYKYLINSLSCLALIGGGDVNPRIYNSLEALDYDYELDKLEFLLIKEALNRKLPIFGICRGLQILNIYFGGTLKEIPASHLGLHNIKLKNDVVKSVNSFHHLCIDTLASNFSILAKSNDFVIEEIEDKKRMIFATQYHPEINFDYEVLNYFLSYLR